jgi:hypothetical protein
MITNMVKNRIYLFPNCAFLPFVVLQVYFEMEGENNCIYDIDNVLDVLEGI